MSRILKISSVALALIALVICVAVARSSHNNRGAWLGVVTQSVDDKLAKAFDLDSDYGVIVNEVVADSPAEEAGLEEDDIIVAVDGERIMEPADLDELLEDHSPGEDVVVQLIRDGQEKKIEVELAKPSRYRRDSDSRFRYSYNYKYNPPTYRHYPYIGVQVRDLTRQLGEFFGVAKGRGALISEVAEGSPSEEAGLKAGDVIIAIAGDKVRDAGDVVDYILDSEPGDKVEITVIREHAEKKFEVEVDETNDRSRFGDAFHELRLPSNLHSLKALDALEALDGLKALDNLKDLDGLQGLDPDLSISIPRAGRSMVSGYSGLDRLDRQELKSELKELRKELIDMQRELREELKTEIEELRQEMDD